MPPVLSWRKTFAAASPCYYYIVASYYQEFIPAGSYTVWELMLAVSNLMAGHTTPTLQGNADGTVAITASSVWHPTGFSDNDGGVWATLGFTGGANGANALTQTAPRVARNAWFPNAYPKADEPRTKQYLRAQGQSLSGVGRSLHFGSQEKRLLKFELLQPERVYTDRESAASTGIERLFDDGGGYLALYEDFTNEAADAAPKTYMLDHGAAGTFAPKRAAAWLDRYAIDLPLKRLA